MAFSTTKSYTGPTMDYSDLLPGDVFWFVYPAAGKMPTMLSSDRFVKGADGRFRSTSGVGAWRSMDTVDAPRTRLVARA